MKPFNRVRCPRCESTKTRSHGGRYDARRGWFYRRRYCQEPDCLFRFTTYEIPAKQLGFPKRSDGQIITRIDRPVTKPDLMLEHEPRPPRQAAPPPTPKLRSKHYLQNIGGK